MTSRERVTRTLTFDNPDRIPRDIWGLPYSQTFRKDDMDLVCQRFPMDFVSAPGNAPTSTRTKGEPFTIGTYVDEWGCAFTVAEEGVVGEVVNPSLTTEADMAAYRPPYELIAGNLDHVSAFCRQTDSFVLAGQCARPFERLQFLRGSEQTMIDIAEDNRAMRDLIATIHAYYMDEIVRWAQTDVDAVMFMDDWGSQRQLLISPVAWRELFRPLYREYVDVARQHGKFIFMHSDGHIEAIYPDLVELGIDAVNSQLFCMDIEALAAFKGKITFWGEIDRQHILPRGTTQDVQQAVRRVRRALDNGRGGLIAQCEFGKVVPTENIMTVFETWGEPQPSA